MFKVNLKVFTKSIENQNEVRKKRVMNKKLKLR